MTKRILLKLSGEQLQGEFASGFDPKRARWIAEQIKPALETGAEVVIMVGGGNYVRGNQIIGHGIQPVSAHNIGMLSTLMNAIALADIFNDADLPTHASTSTPRLCSHLTCGYTGAALTPPATKRILRSRH